MCCDEDRGYGQGDSWVSLFNLIPLLALLCGEFAADNSWSPVTQSVPVQYEVDLLLGVFFLF